MFSSLLKKDLDLKKKINKTKNFKKKLKFFLNRAAPDFFSKKPIYNLVDFKATKTHIMPSKKNLKNHLDQIKYIIFKLQGNTQESLINKISPIINKWSNFYKIISIQRILNNCDFFLMKIIWKWCLKRHHDKSNIWTREKYFYLLNNQKFVFATKKPVYLNSAAPVFLASPKIQKNQKSIESNESISSAARFKVIQDYKNMINTKESNLYFFSLLKAKNESVYKGYKYKTLSCICLNASKNSAFSKKGYQTLRVCKKKRSFFFTFFNRLEAFKKPLNNILKKKAKAFFLEEKNFFYNIAGYNIWY